MLFWVFVAGLFSVLVILEPIVHFSGRICPFISPAIYAAFLKTWNILAVSRVGATYKSPISAYFKGLDVPKQKGGREGGTKQRVKAAATTRRG